MPEMTTVPCAGGVERTKPVATPETACVRSMIAGELNGTVTSSPVTVAIGGFTVTLTVPGDELPPGPTAVYWKLSAPK